MIFFGKKRKHKLPKFPPFIIPVFEQLCEVLTEPQCHELEQNIQDVFLKKISQEEDQGFFDEEQARQILQACTFLLEEYPKRNSKEKALIVGAVRYAAGNDDLFCDHGFASGMTDDKQIINYVLEELGIHDRYLLY